MATYGADLYGRSKYGGREQVDFGVDPVTADPVNFSTVRISWNEPSGNWNAFRVIRNRAGYAVNEADGLIVYSQTTAGPTPGTLVDTGLTGGWVYYTILLFNVDFNEWERVGTADVLVPYDFNSMEKLQSLVPEYYRNIRDTGAGFSQTLFNINPQVYLSSQDMVDNDQFLNFLNVFGWGVDTLRTQADTIMDGYSPDRVHLNRLALLADQFGGTVEPAAPAPTQRSLIKNLALLYRKRGTQEGLQELMSLVTGWNVEVFLGPNLMLNTDQSAFTNPQIPNWDQYTRYVVGDIVRYGQWYYQALQTAYGPAQAPNASHTDNAYWNASIFIDPLPNTSVNRPDTGDVGTWQVVTPAGVINGGTQLGLGAPDPVDASIVNTNVLMFRNDTASPVDITVRSIPRYTSNPTIWDRQLTVGSGVPVPRVTDVNTWVAGTYVKGDQVKYLGLPYVALVKTTQTPSPSATDWQLLGVDSRVRLALSLYAHGPFNGTAGTGGVPAYPYFVYFNEQGDFLGEVVCAPTVLQGLVYDPFYVTGTVTTGRFVEVGQKSWASGGVGTWNQGADASGGYAYPTAAGRTYQIIDSGRADCNVGVTYRRVGTRAMGVIFRYLDANNYWIANTTGLTKVVAGVATSVATWSGFVDGDRLSVVLSGNNITVKRNGGNLTVQTDAFNATATKHGVEAEA